MWSQSNKSFIDPQSLHVCLPHSRLICIYINIFNWEKTQPSKSALLYPHSIQFAYKKARYPHFVFISPLLPVYVDACLLVYAQCIDYFKGIKNSNWIVNKQQQQQRLMWKKQHWQQHQHQQQWNIAHTNRYTRTHTEKISNQVYWLKRVPVPVPMMVVVVQPQAFIGNANDCFRFH